MRKFYLLFVFVSLYSVGASAQIEGYYRLRNGSGVDGKAYLNVQNEKLEPTMTADDVVSATSSVFYLKTGKNLGTRTAPYYQIEELKAQGIDGLETINLKGLKTLMQSFPKATFDIIWGIFKSSINANETIKNQIDQINSNYGIDLDAFTYEEYKKWVETFDTNFYTEENTSLLYGKAYRFYINFPDLPDTLRKERNDTTFLLGIPVSITKRYLQDDLNTAMLVIGPLLNIAVKQAIKNNLAVNALINESTAPTLFMMLDAMERIQFGKKLYFIEDDKEPRFAFAHEGEISLTGLVDLGTITKALEYGRWYLENIDENNMFSVKVDENIKTAFGTYITTFYSEFPYRLYDDMKAYVAEEITTTGSALSGGVKGHLSPKLIAAQGEIVPAKTPVIIETHSTEPNGNRLIPLLSDATFEGTNKLSGTLRKDNLSVTPRLLGTESNTPAFTSSLVSSIPENTAYFEAGSLPGSELLFTKPTVVYIETEAPTVTITPAKEKTTFCSIRNLDFTDSELKAYVVSEITSTHAILKQVYKVKAGTGLILIGTAKKEYIVPEIAEENAENVENLLIGTTKSTTIRAGQAYLLSDGVFKKSTSGGLLNPGTTLAAGKAYLPASAVPATAREFTVVFEDMTTGITTVNEDATATGNAVIYDLNGQRVTAPGKGIYIVRGKKMIIK